MDVLASSSDSEDELPSIFHRIGYHEEASARDLSRAGPSHSSPIVVDDSVSPVSKRIAVSSGQSLSRTKPADRRLPNKESGSNRSHDHSEPSSDTVKRARLQTSEKELAQQERMERKKQQALEKRQASEAKRLEKEKKQDEKKRQNEMKKALRKATSDASKETRGPAERVKQMIVVLDRVLVENAELMAELTTELGSLGVEYQVGSSDMHPGSVKWKRKISERSVDEEAKIIENTIEVEENELLVTLEGQGLIGLVHCTKQVDRGIPLQDRACTLQQYVEELHQNNPGVRISLAVEGVESFLRGNKTHFNRNFRAAVRKNAPVSSKERLFSDVTSVDCMEALAGLQLTTNCVARMFNDKQQLAMHLAVMTKALSEAHYRKENPFSFHVEAGQGASRQALRETDNKVSLIWKHQLMQFNNISDSMASAVVAVYPSPSHLIKAYESSSDKKTAELLLQDIVIRRGVGVVASTRRFGPAQSKRIHTLMTSQDPKLTLS